MKTIALVGLGSNLGDRRSILKSAIAAMVETDGVEVISVSRFHETDPIGGPPGQGPFLNAAARLMVEIGPTELLGRLRLIEGEAGRVRPVRWGERTLDLDLLIYDSRLIDSGPLVLPHPRMAVRRFVLVPLAEIAPEIVEVRTGLTIRKLLANLDRRPSLIALDGADGPLKRDLFEVLVSRLDARPVLRAAPVPTGAAWPDLASLPASLEKLGRTRWPSDPTSEEWIVADFCPHLEGRRAGLPWRHSPEGRPIDGSGSGADLRSATREVLQALDKTVLPTFAATLPGWVLPPGPRADCTPFPLLRLETGSLDSIRDEILAACDASRTPTRPVAS